MAGQRINIMDLRNLINCIFRSMLTTCSSDVDHPPSGYQLLSKGKIPEILTTVNPAMLTTTLSGQHGQNGIIDYL